MYPTTETLVASSVVPELLAATEAQQDALRSTAIVAVERFTGQEFQPTAPGTTLVEDGTGGEELYLTRRVEELDSVTVNGSELDLTNVTIDEKGERLYFTTLSTNYAVVAMREERAWDSRTFRSGAGSVVLVGTFGWTVCPEAVVQALRLEMEDQARADASELTNVIGIARRLGLADISQGNLRARLAISSRLGGGSSVIGSPSLIAPHAAQLLADYIWRGRGGYLI